MSLIVEIMLILVPILYATVNLFSQFHNERLPAEFYEILPKYSSPLTIFDSVFVWFVRAHLFSENKYY